MHYRPGIAVFSLFAVVPSGLSIAQTLPSHGYEFAKIGHPGNRDTIPSEVPLRPWLEVGRVDYVYRISTTEVNATQWLEFVEAYAPYWTGSPSDPSFTSWYIYPGAGQYVIQPGAEHWPVQVSWESAARYSNWLHNGKGSGQEAFENGAYDTSTFTIDPQTGNYNHQRTHNPDATFWLPTWDEWVKAVHYDPNRYGAGVEGYWQYPNASDTWLISGLPVNGGETNAGPALITAGVWGMDVGSYPYVIAPWGLLDSSGGWSEWTEDVLPMTSGLRRAMGSYQRDQAFMVTDRLDDLGYFTPPNFGLNGIRLASPIPEPASIAIVTSAVVISLTRRRI